METTLLFYLDINWSDNIPINISFSQKILLKKVFINLFIVSHKNIHQLKQALPGFFFQFLKSVKAREKQSVRLQQSKTGTQV